MKLVWGTRRAHGGIGVKIDECLDNKGPLSIYQIAGSMYFDAFMSGVSLKNLRFSRRHLSGMTGGMFQDIAEPMGGVIGLFVLAF